MIDGHSFLVTWQQTDRWTGYYGMIVSIRLMVARRAPSGWHPPFACIIALAYIGTWMSGIDIGVQLGHLQFDATWTIMGGGSTGSTLSLYLIFYTS